MQLGWTHRPPPEPSSSGAPPSSPKTAAKEASRRRVEEARARLRAQDVDDTGKVTNPNPRVDDYTRVEDTVRVRVDVVVGGGGGVCGGNPSRFDLSGRFATARLATPANVVNANLESQLRYSFQDERAVMERLRLKKQRLDAFTVVCSKFTARGIFSTESSPHDSLSCTQSCLMVRCFMRPAPCR